MYHRSQKMKYVHDAIIAIRTQANIANESKKKGDIEKYNTVLSMIRDELFFINLIGIIDYKNYEILQQIVNRMIIN